MKHFNYIIFTLFILMFWSSCRKDFEFTPSNGQLQFSKDTVYLDTVFTNIGSSTYQLKVYNRSNNDIVIPLIKLASGEASNYRLSIDGIYGKIFNSVELLANDSLFVFIENTTDINKVSDLNSYLYTDKIEFHSASKLQTVELVTLVKDAIFIYPNRENTTKVIETLTLNIGGDLIETNLQGRELLPEELTLTNEKPYVIYGFATVPENQTLTIEAGARLHFHENSGIIVSNGASLHVNGSYSSDQELLENEVVFEGDRLEPNFSEIPGQWGTIWLLDGSVNNIINYATIKNATLGVLSDGNPDEITEKLVVKNTQIYNSSSFGIMGRNTSILAENLVINNSGQTSFAATAGGKYNVTHSTLVNYWNNSFRQLPAVLINNYIIDENEDVILADLTEANFNNCIIYGNDNPEVLLDQAEDQSAAFNFKFTNCLIRFEDNNNNFKGPNYNFNDTTKYESIIFNKDPDFLDTKLNKLFIGDGSAAINKGLLNYATQVPLDILNANRTTTPDLGAYQHTTPPSE